MEQHDVSRAVTMQGWCTSQRKKGLVMQPEIMMFPVSRPLGTGSDQHKMGGRKFVAITRHDVTHTLTARVVKAANGVAGFHAITRQYTFRT